MKHREPQTKTWRPIAVTAPGRKPSWFARLLTWLHIPRRSSDWNLPGNWEPYGIPQSGDSAIIPPGSYLSQGLDQSGVDLESLVIRPRTRLKELL